MPAKSGGGLQPRHEFHGACRVDVHEDAHVRCAERARHHRRRDGLADALDRNDLLAVGSPGRGLDVSEQARLGRVADDVVPRDFTREPGPDQAVELDAEILGQFANRRLRNDRGCRCRRHRGGSRGSGAGGHSWNRGLGTAATPTRRSVPARAVSDQGGWRLVFGRDARGRVHDRRDRVIRRLRRRRRAGRDGALADGDDRRSDLDGLALLHEKRGHGAREG